MVQVYIKWQCASNPTKFAVHYTVNNVEHINTVILGSLRQYVLYLHPGDVVHFEIQSVGNTPSTSLGADFTVE